MQYPLVSPAIAEKGHRHPAQFLELMKHFVSKGAMDIDGLGEQWCRILIDQRLVADLADLYKLTNEQLLELDRMGEKLAEKVEREWPDHDIDVVIPIPDTSRTSALQMANHLGVKYREGFIKNRYIGRTFIMPGQQQRKKSVRQKLNAIELEFKGKNVLLVDDSIVRGTTCNEIIQMAREAGARKVYFASAAPAVQYPNVYGIDMPAAQELIAHGRTTEEIGKLIGADKLIYQDLEDLVETCKEGNPGVESFDCSVFNGTYLAGNITPEYLAGLEARRNDMAKGSSEKTRALADNEIIDLHNPN